MRRWAPRLHNSLLKCLRSRSPQHTDQPCKKKTAFNHLITRSMARGAVLKPYPHPIKVTSDFLTHFTLKNIWCFHLLAAGFQRRCPGCIMISGVFAVDWTFIASLKGCSSCRLYHFFFFFALVSITITKVTVWLPLLSSFPTHQCHSQWKQPAPLTSHYIETQFLMNIAICIIHACRRKHFTERILCQDTTCFVKRLTFRQKA